MRPGILVALDLADLDEAVLLASALAPHVAGFKVGLELLSGPQPHTIERIAELGKPIFVDAKLHDIPATVERAARQLGLRGARWVTAHAPGGTEMMRAAVNGLAEGSGHFGGILGVTVLTSIGEEDLGLLGTANPLSAQVMSMTRLASESGAEGVICSVAEVDMIKTVGDLVAVTPGIRLKGDPNDDQKRVVSVEEALASAADYLVMGRSITRSDDPVKTVQRINGIGDW